MFVDSLECRSFNGNQHNTGYDMGFVVIWFGDILCRGEF